MLKKSTKRQIVSVFSTTLIGVGLVLILYFVVTKFMTQAQVQPPDPIIISPSTVSSSSSSESVPPKPTKLYSKNQLFLSTERLTYTDGAAVLRVPRLDLEVPVLGEIDPGLQKKLASGSMTKQELSDFFGNSASEALLIEGVVLLNSATLPNDQYINPNVSISGHRDIYGCEFYHIHTITDGDKMYLQWNGREYVYEYVETKIHAADEWSVLYCKDESTLTLISCDPIGTSWNRIVVTGRLVDSYPLDSASSQTGSSPASPSSGA